MTPTVIIGLGGTGKEILIKIRRMIVEQYGSLDALPIVSFLHIDTEQNAKVSEAQTVLKQGNGTVRRITRPLSGSKHGTLIVEARSKS
ncbi:MAG: tubulin-like doman-containing protein [Nodosilinea sp.]